MYEYSSSNTEHNLQMCHWHSSVELIAEVNCILFPFPCISRRFWFCAFFTNIKWVRSIDLCRYERILLFRCCIVSVDHHVTQLLWNSKLVINAYLVFLVVIGNWQVKLKICYQFTLKAVSSNRCTVFSERLVVIQRLICWNSMRSIVGWFCGCQNSFMLNFEPL